MSGSSPVNPDPALAWKNEHDAVVRYLCEVNATRFKALNNLDGDKHAVASIFPDIILKDSSDNLFFIIEVRRNGKIAECMQQWKTVPKIPAVLYFIVPENDLSSAKAVAQVVGLQAKFGAYQIDADGKVTVKYE